MSRQTEFTDTGVKAMSRELTPRDLEIMRQWKSNIGQCPWCFHSGDLWSFATFLKRKKKDLTVSENDCRCPDCGIRLKRQTLIKIYNMDMTAYGEWFWGAVFSGSYEKVSWDALKARLKAGFSYNDVQPFWTAYWKNKELSLGGWDTEDDDDAYEDYAANYTEEEEPQ